MNKIIYLAILLVFFVGCGGDNKTTSTLKKNSKIDIIVYNDSLDPDFVPLVLGALNAKKMGYNIGFIVEGRDTKGKTAMLYDCIAKHYDLDIPIGLNKGYTRVANYKTTVNLEQYCPNSPYDKATPSAKEMLRVMLEGADDDSVTMVTGGELYALSEFLKDDYNRDLFKLKINRVIIGTGCDILRDNAKTCSYDFNLARDKDTKEATNYVLNRIRKDGDPLAIRVDAITNNIQHNIRALDYYKNHPKESPIKYILSQNHYGTFGDHHKGDLETLILATRPQNFTLVKTGVKIGFKGSKLGIIGKGIDSVYKDNTNYKSLMLQIFKDLDKK